MASDEKHVCEICGCADYPVIFQYGMFQHAHSYECVAAIRNQRKELRALLETATDAWLDGGQLWPDDPRHGAYKCSALSRDWYEKARKAVEHE